MRRGKYLLRYMYVDYASEHLIMIYLTYMILINVIVTAMISIVNYNGIGPICVIENPDKIDKRAIIRNKRDLQIARYPEIGHNKRAELRYSSISIINRTIKQASIPEQIQ